MITKLSFPIFNRTTTIIVNKFFNICMEIQKYTNLTFLQIKKKKNCKFTKMNFLSLKPTDTSPPYAQTKEKNPSDSSWEL